MNGYERLLEALRPADWMGDAACRGMDPDLLFPIKHGDSGREVEKARKVCRACPVTNDCLEYALNNREKYGVWGGMSVRERAEFLKQRRQRQADEERRSRFLTGGLPEKEAS